MMHLAGWMLAVLCVAALGYSAGTMNGRDIERSIIGNECRTSGGFTVKRTGFKCEVVR